MDMPGPAEKALQLLFKKLHPHLEDAAHALDKGAPPEEFERLHRRLVLACHQVSEILDAMALEADEGLAEVLETLSANLLPVGAPYRQQLTLVQLCLEEAPADLLPHAPEGCVAGSAWGPRMVAFLARLEDPAFQARARWAEVDPDVGEEPIE